MKSCPECKSEMKEGEGRCTLCGAKTGSGMNRFIGDKY